MAAAQPPLIDYNHLKEMADTLSVAAASFVAEAGALFTANGKENAKVDTGMTASISLKSATDERLAGLAVRRPSVDNLIASLHVPSEPALAYPRVATTSYCFRYADRSPKVTMDWTLAALAPLL